MDETENWNRKQKTETEKLKMEEHKQKKKKKQPKKKGINVTQSVASYPGLPTYTRKTGKDWLILVM